MGNILLVAEIQNGSIREASYELVAFANKVAETVTGAMDRSRLAKMYWPEAQPAYRIVPPGIEGRI